MRMLMRSARNGLVVWYPDDASADRKVVVRISVSLGCLCVFVCVCACVRVCSNRCTWLYQALQQLLVTNDPEANAVLLAFQANPSSWELIPYLLRSPVRACVSLGPSSCSRGESPSLRCVTCDRCCTALERPSQSVCCANVAHQGRERVVRDQPRGRTRETRLSLRFPDLTRTCTGNGTGALGRSCHPPREPRSKLCC